MVNLSIPISDDLKKIIEKHKEINWVKIAQEALQDQARKVYLLFILTLHSKLTENDTADIGNKIKLEIAKKHGL